MEVFLFFWFLLGIFTLSVVVAAYRMRAEIFKEARAEITDLNMLNAISYTEGVLNSLNFTTQLLAGVGIVIAWPFVWYVIYDIIKR